MKKLIIAAAAFAAFSASAFAQSNDGSMRSLHSAPDYAAIQAGQDGTPVGLKILEAEQLYDQYND